MISVPARLRVFTGLILLSIPLIIFEAILVSRIPWWDFPVKYLQILTLVSLIILFPLVISMAKGRRWALHLTGLIAVGWCLVSIVLAILDQSFWLGVYSLFLCVFWIFLWSSIYREMSRSFFDPQMSWYQGLPKPIPGLVCEMKIPNIKRGKPSLLRRGKLPEKLSNTLLEAETRKFRVSRMDRDGTFLYTSSVPPKAGKRIFPTRARDRVYLTFHYEGKEASCWGAPVRVLNSELGMGLSFLYPSADMQKELGDFVEMIRGRGSA